MLKTQIIGLLGADATLSEHNGFKVANFSVCHSEKYKDGNGVLVNKSVWVSVGWFLKSTTILQYLKKGTSVYIEGTPSVDTYRNKDGQTVAQLRLRASMVQLLGGNKQENNNQQQTPQQQRKNPPTHEEFLASGSDVIDDLPF